MKKETNQSPLQGNKMGVMPVGKLLFNMAAPMIVSMLVQALYNIVDSVYVSQISENAVTAMGLAFPVQNIQIGFATGIGVGVNSLLSKSLGEGNQERANRAAGNGVLLALCATVLFMLLGIFAMRPFYSIQSDVAQTVDNAVTYSSICCIGTLGVMMSVLFERLLQATGRTFHTMITQGTGAIINIILDPILIFGYFGLPAMGIAGAALATVIGQWSSATLGLIFNLKFNHDVRLRLKNVRPCGEILKPIFAVGIPSIIMVGIGSVMTFTMNQILSGFKGVGETGVGVFGIYFKLQSFFFMPLFGLNNATISIVAYNYGARNPKRMTQTLKIACIAASVVMFFGLLAFELVPQTLLGFFNPTDTFLEVGCRALRVIGLHYPLAAICIALGASFQAMGNGIYSTITSMCRQLIVLLPAAYLLSLTGSIHMVWWAFPIAEFMSLAATLFFFRRIYRQKIKPLYN